MSSHPKGLAYIIGNEAAERFSYYGMRGILVVFMTGYLLDRSGARTPMSDQDATFWFHVFGMANYFFPLLGALIADVVWGKYKTIIVLSVVYCLGHLALAVDDTRLGLAVGLSLIAVGSGGIKPCVSAHLGDQYHHYPARLLSEGYTLFYLAINVGAFLSSLATPLLLAWYGPQVAFAVPGVLMAIATVIFWRGRTVYTARPPTPWRKYVDELAHPGQKGGLIRVGLLFVILSVFWSLFDQTGSSWVLQAEHMNQTLSLPFGISVHILPSQLQAFNPILIVLFAPLFTWVVYPALQRRNALSARGKIVTGMVLAGLSFFLIGYAQRLIEGGEIPSILWQLLAYVLLTAAEVVVSITTLEFSYTSAPTSKRSLVTSFYLLSVALGNGLTALLVGPLHDVVGSQSSPGFFYFFGGLSIVASVFVWVLFSFMRSTGSMNVANPARAG